MKSLSWVFVIIAVAFAALSYATVTVGWPPIGFEASGYFALTCFFASATFFVIAVVTLIRERGLCSS